MSNPSRYPSRIAQFRLLEKLGRGGMGVVFKAHDTRLGRSVALKLLNTEHAGEAVSRKRLISEAQAAAALNHPHIATLYEMIESDQGLCLVMEYVPGATLENLLRQSPATPDRIIVWARAIAEAIAEAHRHGIVHRDIKAANVMVTPRDSIKILDFGLAHMTNRLLQSNKEGADRLTEDGTIVGTVDYLAPELLRGEPASPGSDVFALGVLFYLMTGGALPFRGRTPAVILTKILNEDAPPLECEPGSPLQALHGVIRKALAKQASERYTDAGELATDLEASVESRRITGTEVGDKGKEIAVPPNNLPSDLTPFIGHSIELDELDAAIETGRLITLTGLGGTGKSRLAIELGRRLIDRFPGGVFHIDFASLQPDGDGMSLIATAVGIREESPRTVLDQLIDSFRDHPTLLLFDNCEHVLDVAGDSARRLLEASPLLCVIATSRDRLEVPGESVHPVRALSLPDPGTKNLSIEELLEYESVRLFVDRALASHSGFAVSEKNGDAVVSICRKLDGIPLAIELAAARTRVLSIEQIDKRLENRFHLLTSRNRRTSARHQTLRATIDWSVDLLDDLEKLLFFRSGIFPGSFDLGAAEVICSGGVIEEFDVLDLISTLVDRSIVVAEEGADGTVRYRLYETLRAYASGELAAAEIEPLGIRYENYYSDLAMNAAAELTGPDQLAWFARLDREFVNLRTMLDRAATRNDSETLLETTAALGRYWLVRGHLSEGRRHSERALQLARKSRTDDLVAQVLLFAGSLANDQGDYETAIERLEAALDMRKKLKDRSGAAEAAVSLGITARDQGDYERAGRFLTEAVAATKKLGEPARVAQSIHALGITRHREGECERAAALFEEGLAIRESLGDPRGIAAFHAHLGSVAYDQGDLDRSTELLERGLATFREVGNSRGIVYALLYLGGIDRRHGRYEEARTRFKECLDTSYELGDRLHVARSIESFAQLAAEEGNGEIALKLAGAADSIRSSLGSLRPPIEETAFRESLAMAREQAGEKRTRELMEAGAAISSDSQGICSMLTD